MQNYSGEEGLQYHLHVNKRIYTSYNKTRQILSYHMIYDIIFAK